MMFITIDRWLKLWMLSALALLLIFSAPSHADNLTIEQLMQLLAKAKPSHAIFIEKKYIALLDEPVESSGELFFTAPDHLEKRTLTPKPESLVVEGNRILIVRGSKTYYFTFQNMPELGVFLNSIRSTLAGDLQSLKDNFELRLEENQNKWILQLVPINAKVQKLLKHIRITGINDQIKSIKVSQIDGDSSLMTIMPFSKTP